MQQFRLSNSQAILLSKWVLDNALSWWCMPCLPRRENILSRPSVQTGYFLKRGPDHLPIFERCLLSGTSISCNWGHSHDAGLSYCDSKTASLELLGRLNAWSKCPTKTIEVIFCRGLVYIFPTITLYGQLHRSGLRLLRCYSCCCPCCCCYYYSCCCCCCYTWDFLPSYHQSVPHTRGFACGYDLVDGIIGECMFTYIYVMYIMLQ
jgi:hypothetical protein